MKLNSVGQITNFWLIRLFLFFGLLFLFIFNFNIGHVSYSRDTRETDCYEIEGIGSKTPVNLSSNFCLNDRFRKTPWTEADLRYQITEFLPIYNKRIFGRRQGGMQFEHSFYFWFLLRQLRPSVVIENGVFDGHSTWLIQQAVPGTPIYSFDPADREKKFPNVNYYRGDNFVDFLSFEWHKENFNKSNALVLLDDHQAGFTRIISAMKFGFRHFIVDDNYVSKRGDNFSPRKVCDQKQPDTIYNDNFNKIQWSIPLRLATAYARMFVSTFEIYYEFPPVASNLFTGHSRFDEGDSAIPLLLKGNKEGELLYHKLRETLSLENFLYTHMCYIKTY